MRKTLQFAFYKMIEMFINVSTYIALKLVTLVIDQKQIHLVGMVYTTSISKV